MKDILYFNTVEDIRLLDTLRVLKKHDYSKDYLTFEALEDGTFTLTIPTVIAERLLMTSVSYSIDDGANWVTTIINDTAKTITTPTLSAGDKVLWKGIGNQTGRMTGFSAFSSTCNFNIFGNIMSLLYGDEFKNLLEFPSQSTYTFYLLFKNVTKLIDASNLILPVITLVSYCYDSMFSDCASLVSAPKLPATTLADACYASMFQNCTSLTKAPELLAATLISSCYNSMFKGCTSLTSAPVLPATILSTNCYYRMFYNCSNLNYIKAMFTTTPSNTYTMQWVYNVAATGTFVKNSAATWNVTDVNGIPSGWAVETADS